MRAVLLTSIVDPFILRLWLHTFEKWSPNIDRAYISLAHKDEKYQPVVDYCREFLSENPKIQLVEPGREMNDAFHKLLTAPIPEDTFLLTQDDAYIFDAGMVDACFRSIEEGWTDIVASNQFTYPSWLNKYLIQLYPWLSGQENRGLAFYPNFFFGKVKDVQDTKLGITVQQWPKDTPIEVLNGAILPETADMDLMAALSLELRHKGLRWQYVPQYQDGYWEQFSDKKIPWTHVTGLSAIWNAIVSGVDKESNAYPHNVMLQRLTWYVLAFEMFTMPELQWFEDEYKDAIDNIMKISGVTRKELEPRINYFKNLL